MSCRKDAEWPQGYFRRNAKYTAMSTTRMGSSALIAV